MEGDIKVNVKKLGVGKLTRFGCLEFQGLEHDN